MNPARETLRRSGHRSACGSSLHRRLFARSGGRRVLRRHYQPEDRKHDDQRRDKSRPAGAYTPGGGAEIDRLPAFCRVHGVIEPVPGSRIGFELWLPDASWNGKIEMFGNGGYSSKMSYGSLGDQLKRGYATLATDTGHQGDDPDFAIGHPEAIVDWGHRAVHESIAAAKAIVAAHFAEPARHSYFWGCSTGGHQAVDGGATLSDRFRRDRRRRSGQQSNSSERGIFLAVCQESPRFRRDDDHPSGPSSR